MGFIKSTGKGLKGVSIEDPRTILTDLLRTSSGSSVERTMRYNIFYQIVAFKGIKDGLGCSTIVANTALAMARLGLNVCVVDTSILSPSQDILLKTNYKNAKKNEVVDWFDMGFTGKSVLNISSIDKKISVLSFQNRTMIDLLSTSDNESLVDLAFTQLVTKFDIVLVDLCNEPSCISTTAMQLAHKVVQIWSDSEVVLRSVESFIQNNIICSCSMDKMRSVVTSNTYDEVTTDWDSLMKKYHFKHIAHVGKSEEIAKRSVTGQAIYNSVTSDAGIQQFNDCITDIVCHLLDINSETGKAIGTYTFDDVVEGRVDGTLSQLYQNASDYPEISQKAVDQQTGVSEEVQTADIYNSSSSTEDYMQDYVNQAEAESDVEEDADLFEEPPKKRGLFGRKG